MNILGISSFYHDSAACLVRDGEILAAAQEERFSRIKHDSDFPKQAIAYCLQAAGLTSGSELDLVAFYEKPFAKFDRILSTSLALAPRGLRPFLKAAPTWIKQKIWLKEIIRRELEFEGKIVFPEHHESHAASAFFPSPFEEAAVLTIDGVGEWTTSSIGHGSGNRIELLRELRFPHSLGLLYSAFTYYLGFRVNSGEYKVMGLAPYGEPRFRDRILAELIDLKPDGSLRLNLKYFNFLAGLTMTNRRFAALFEGPRRQPEMALTQRHMDVARSLQAVVEEAMLRMARHAHALTKSSNLCLAGGVALNCVSNGRILREGPFEKIWIQPAAGDAGGALGAALLAWHQFENKPREISITGGDRQHGSFLGPDYDAGEFLRTRKITATELPNDDLFGEVARLLAQGHVVGWYQGRMEFGPRALGNRSILADPRIGKMQETLNLKIKFRESFRPFAPSVLRERVSDYFELEEESPYMLLVAAVKSTLRKDEKQSAASADFLERLKAPRSTIPAVTHVDYSARVQTVSAEENPRFHQLLTEFEQQTGCAVLVNTSFNVRGEPPVCTPEDAYRCFMRTGMDYLVLGNFLVVKAAQLKLATSPADELVASQLD
ncbi:MAG: carbamoyltransferase [Chthoniobacterales bacterium]|nr:carbamoyltransferase [Chthoniobacterales bacterium]